MHMHSSPVSGVSPPVDNAQLISRALHWLCMSADLLQRTGPACRRWVWVPTMPAVRGEAICSDQEHCEAEAVTGAAGVPAADVSWEQGYTVNHRSHITAATCC
jgi:hypothetical protein